MNTGRYGMLPIIGAFFLGFALGGTSFHFAAAQGLMGLSGSVTQLSQALASMEKNMQQFQDGMAKIKQVKEQLATLPGQTTGKAGEALKQQGESVKKSLPGLGQ